MKTFFGILLIISGIFDSIKYYWMGKKIKEVKTSKGYSRKALNIAITNDLIKLVYSMLIKDVNIFLTSIIALITMIYCFWQIYIYYPYKNRRKKNFKRPNIFLYIWNSILPNKLREKL